MANTPATSVSSHIAVIDGQPTTTTQDIADVYGKDHAKVLRIVRQRMAEAGEWGVANFGDTPYTNPQNGQTYTVIRMTKKGFHFVVGKFTGAKAVAHQIAFADEFERMETALLTQQPAALPTTTITPAQKQHLHELVDLIAATGKQSHAETWARLHRKFQVNKYELLRHGQFDAACEYLRGKMDGQDIGALVKKHLPNALRNLSAATPPAAPDPAIDPVELLPTGQSDPLEHLSSTQRTLIAQRAFELANEAYGLIHTHIERRVAFRAINGATSDGAVDSIAKGVTLGNALTHCYMKEIGTMASTIKWLQVTAQQAGQMLNDDMARFGRA